MTVVFVMVVVVVVTVVVLVGNVNNPMADPPNGRKAGTLESQMTDSKPGRMTDPAAGIRSDSAKYQVAESLTGPRTGATHSPRT